MKKSIAAALLVGAMVFAACGGQTETGQVSKEVDNAPTKADSSAKQVEAEPTPEPAPEPEPPSDDCDELGINAQELNEGACTLEGTDYKVVNRDHKLNLEEVSVKVAGVSAQDTIEVPYDTPLTGSFVVAQVEVTNRMDAPVDIDASEMFVLGIDGKEFSADFDAMNTGSDDGLLYEPIQPYETKTGSVVFRVAPQLRSKLETDGMFLTYQFSDVGSYDAPAKRIGLTRLYN